MYPAGLAETAEEVRPSGVGSGGGRRSSGRAYDLSN
jgi:hypothetical protein